MVHEKFEEYLVKAVGTETAARVSAALGREASVSIRFHPFKTAGLPVCVAAVSGFRPEACGPTGFPGPAGSPVISGRNLTGDGADSRVAADFRNGADSVSYFCPEACGSADPADFAGTAGFPGSPGPARSPVISGRDLTGNGAGSGGAADFRNGTDSAFGLPTAFSAEIAPGVPALLSGRVAWSPCGYFLDRRPQFTPDPSWHGGQYYVQDSSAMFVGHAFRQVLREYATLGRPVRVLDLCAAPGGKTTDLAASLRIAFGDRFLLVANEIVRRRAVLLAENAALWGDLNVCVTSCAPAVFSRLPGFFDIVLADVPCSGEGMFRKEAEARSQWSPEKVARCRALQRKIVTDIWPALADGGHFLYSTCTFNGMENDGNAAWICENLGAETLQINDLGEGPLPTACGVLLAPGLVRGEGQYCSLLRKDVSSGGGRTGKVFTAGAAGSPASSGNERSVKVFTAAASESSVSSGNGRTGKLFTAGAMGSPVSSGNGRFGKNFVAGMGGMPSGNVKGGRSGSGSEWERRVGEMLSGAYHLTTRNGTVVALPEVLLPEMELLESLHPLSAGIAVGLLKGGTFVPHADLALSIKLRKEAFHVVELDRRAASAFLHGDCIDPGTERKGLWLLCFHGLPLGFARNVGNRCNSLLPAARRIRKDYSGFATEE